MRAARPTAEVVGPPPQPLDVVPAHGTVAGDSCSCGTGSSDDARRELFAAYDVALTGWRKSLIAAVLNTRLIQKT
jgi:hypothetical protein